MFPMKYLGKDPEDHKKNKLIHAIRIGLKKLLIRKQFWRSNKKMNFDDEPPIICGILKKGFC